MRIEDPDQRLNREVIEGTGASSSRDDAGSEPQSRPVASSVSAQKPPREQSDDADMGDLETDRRRPRAFAVEVRETKRVRNEKDLVDEELAPKVQAVRCQGTGDVAESHKWLLCVLTFRQVPHAAETVTTCFV